MTSLLQTAPKYFKPGLSVYMAPQNGKTCLPSIMAFVNKEKCNGNNTMDYYIERYEDAHPGTDVEEDGIVGLKKEIIDFVNRHFHTKTYADGGGVKKSIDAGNPILTTLTVFDDNGLKELHNILIVGYDSLNQNNPKIYYMDPLYGAIYSNMSLNSFNRSSPGYALCITGCK